MKVLVSAVCFPPAVQCGGSVRSIGALARGLARAGADVRVVTTDSFLTPAQRQPRERALDGVPVTTLPVAKWLGSAIDRYGFAPGLLPLLLRETRWADICVTQGMWTWPLAIVSRICRHRGLPYVLFTRGNLDATSLSEKRLKKRLYLRLVERGTVRGASLLLMSSEAERRSSRPVTGSVPTLILPNAVDVGPRRTPPQGYLHDRLGVPRERILVGISGRIHARKGFDVFLPAMARSDPRLHCVAVGVDDRGYARTVSRLAGELGIVDRLHLPGHLDGAELEDVHASLDLLALPSSGESFGNVVLEALAQGTQVMVSREVPLASYVERHGFGVVVPERTASAWHRALDRWIDGRGRFDAERAARQVRDEFSLEGIGRRCLAALQDVVR